MRRRNVNIINCENVVGNGKELHGRLIGRHFSLIIATANYKLLRAFMIIKNK